MFLFESIGHTSKTEFVSQRYGLNNFSPQKDTREIFDLEDAANLWKTYPYVGNKFCTIYAGKGFGGYADWTYENFDAKLSIRNDHAEDFEPFTVGTYGLCIRCGCEIAERLYGSCCKEYADDDDEVMCDGCGEYVHDTYPVINSAGNRSYVCGDCRDGYYDTNLS